MHVLEELSYTLEDMIEPISKKQDISPTELDNVYKATKTMYYIETIKAMNEYGNSNEYNSYNSYAGGNSNRGNSRAYRGSYTGRMGMDGDGDGRYSERRGRNSNGRYSNGYSRDDAKDEMIMNLENMMNESNSEQERQTIRDCIRRIESDR